MSDDSTNSRRRFLHLAGVTALTAGLAGCGGGGGDGGGETTADGGGETTAGGGDTPTSGGGETTTSGGSSDAEVPEAYRTATAQNGQQRDPDNLVAPSALNYQEEPNNGNQCSGCQFYIPDQNGDGMGACTLITGMVDPQGWCNSYAAYEGS
jgi:hypothetical protein